MSKWLEWIYALGDIEVAESAGCICPEDIIEKLDQLKTLIPTFFSSKNRGTDIKRIYQLVESNKYILTKIWITNLGQAVSLYNQYKTGMHEHILDIIYLDENCRGMGMQEIVKKIEGDLAVIKEKDQAFLTSIFGGGLNQQYEGSLADALTSVETCIDITPAIEREQKRINRLNDLLIKTTGAKDCEIQEVLNSAVCLYAESVFNFYSELIHKIMDTYVMIESVMENHDAPNYTKIKKPVSVGRRAR